jgi:hypothetical protein
MKFLTFSVLLLSLVAVLGSDELTTQQIVGTWLYGSRADLSSQNGHKSFSIAFLADGSFSTTFLSTNHTVELTYQGTWRVKDGEVVLTETNVSGSVPHEPVGSVGHIRIVELNSNHLAYAYQSASNCVMTNIFVRKP